jgi:hypothetical protein
MNYTSDYAILQILSASPLAILSIRALLSAQLYVLQAQKMGKKKPTQIDVG